MGYNVADLFEARERDRFALHSRYLNEQMVRVLERSGMTLAFVVVRGNISTIERAFAISIC